MRFHFQLKTVVPDFLQFWKLNMLVSIEIAKGILVLDYGFDFQITAIQN